MATNNPYSRSFKTKREEYEEKLKQRNENEEWIFGNSFGRPGAGAPLRDKNGNIISNLKSVTNQNLYKYDAQEFSKGDNNISVVNHKIYERNASNGNIDHVISDPFTPFRSYINQFDPNSTNNINNNANVANINNINNINQNQLQIIQQDQLNNLNYLNNQNNQLTGEEQKRELYLNQFKQNPYLVQTPYGLATQYPIVLPYSLNTQNQNIIPNSSSISTNNIFSNGNNNSNNVEYQRPYTSLSQNVNNKLNVNYNNQNNDNEFKYITGGSSSQTAKKYVRKLPESTIFSNNFDQEKAKQEKEQKLDKYKKDLEIQIMENKRRREEEKRKLKEKWKREDINNEKFKEYKLNQKEEYNKLVQNRKEKEASRSMEKFLESSNDYEQVNKSMHSQHNIKSNDPNINQNNNLDQNHIQVQENLNNNYDNNFYNNMDQYQYSPEEQNFKNYIDRQYHMLNDIINNDINNEMKRISEQVDKNYTPFTRKFLLMNTNSKTTAELSMENEKKLKKVQDLIEERKLVDYILGQRERPPTPQKEDENQENTELSVPSYFGINRDKPQNRDLGLHSKSSFITKNDNIANFIASGRNQTEEVNKVGNNLAEKQDINNKFRDYMNDDLDEHLNYNKKLNTQKGTFGTNIRDDEALGGAVNLAKNLDNISTFIPLNNDRQNINLTNEQKMKFVPGINNNFSNVRDRDMDDLFKDLDKICELTNNIDPTSKARMIANNFEGDLNKSKNNTIKEQSELLSNSINNASQNDINSINNKNSVNKDKITEEKSLNSNNKVNSNNYNLTNSQLSSKNNNNNNLTNSQISSKNSNLNNNNLKLNLNTNSNNDIYSNKDGNISSNNEKEEKELSNSQNFNVDLNNEENKNDNINNEHLDSNNNINNQNNMMNNELNNNEVQDNNNQNGEEEEYEYEEVEEDEEVEDDGQ